MGFTRFVEVGRVGLISYGPDMGKVCTIVNVIDHNRVLVDGPETVTGVHRHSLSLKRLMLTDLKGNISLNATQKHAAAPRIRTPEPTGPTKPDDSRHENSRTAHEKALTSHSRHGPSSEPVTNLLPKGYARLPGHRGQSCAQPPRTHAAVHMLVSVGRSGTAFSFPNRPAAVTIF